MIPRHPRWTDGTPVLVGDQVQVGDAEAVVVAVTAWDDSAPIRLDHRSLRAYNQADVDEGAIALKSGVARAGMPRPIPTRERLVRWAVSINLASTLGRPYHVHVSRDDAERWADDLLRILAAVASGTP